MAQTKEIIIALSDEAREIRDSMLASNFSGYLKEDGFEPTRQQLLRDEPQPFPGGRAKNRLEEEVCGSHRVHALSNGEYENIVLYIHGGAWVFKITENHVLFCDELVDRLHAKVYMPTYPLGPKYSYTDTYKMLTELYDGLCEQGKPIYVMGDSAGGTLTLGLTRILKETGRRMPEKIACLCPCVDLSFSNPEAAEIEKRDPMDALYGVLECAKMWTKGADLKDPAYSALYSDVLGYPPTLLLACSEDILTPDILLFHKKLSEAGNDVTLVRGDGHWHVFCVCDVPERQTFIQALKAFCFA